MKVQFSNLALWKIFFPFLPWSSCLEQQLCLEKSVKVKISIPMDKKWNSPLHECRISRIVARIREILNDFGKLKKFPRSMMCVDKDFHYMRGENGCNDDCLRNEKQSWPLRSIFNARDPTTIELNPTLSLTCNDYDDVEIFKKCLFKDPFESRTEFLSLRERGRKGLFHPNEDDYFCCECEYIKCNHFDDDFSLDASSKRYLLLICLICIFKIVKSCNRLLSGDCSIWGMKKCHIFKNVEGASAFCLNCYHFLYERSYLDFCIEGNIFKNALCPGIRYFNLINRGDNFTS